jgi:hypothetical protein
MKKLTILFYAVLISSVAFTQGSIDNEVYFRFGYSSPSWKQFGGTKTEWQDFEFKKKGFMGEVGTIFMLKSIPLPDGMAIGVNADYLSVYWHQFTRETGGSKIDFRTLRLDSKVGPSFTYSPVNNIAFDVYVKADINWFTGTVQTENDDADEADVYGDFFAIGLSTGINVRLSVVMLGFEFNTISPKLENMDVSGTYLGNFIDQNDNGDKSKMPSMTFSLGFSF